MHVGGSARSHYRFLDYEFGNPAQVAVEMMEREACRRKYGKVNPVTDNMMCARAEGAGKEIGRANSLRHILDS